MHPTLKVDDGTSFTVYRYQLTLDTCASKQILVRLVNDSSERVFTRCTAPPSLPARYVRLLARNTHLYEFSLVAGRLPDKVGVDLERRYRRLHVVQV